MAIPATVLPDDEAIRPLDGSDLDGWSVIVNLDPDKDWADSTFTVDGTAPFTIDQTHKADEAPYVVITLAAADLAALSLAHWNLAEDAVFGRTFLTQLVRVVDR